MQPDFIINGEELSTEYTLYENGRLNPGSSVFLLSTINYRQIGQVNVYMGVKVNKGKYYICSIDSITLQLLCCGDISYYDVFMRSNEKYCIEVIDSDCEHDTVTKVTNIEKVGDVWEDTKFNAVEELLYKHFPSNMKIVDSEFVRC